MRSTPNRPRRRRIPRIASRAERELAYLQADAVLLKAEHALKFKAKPVAGAKPAPAKKNEAGEKKRDEAKKALDAALMALSEETGNVASLGPVYPETSTGRRLALGRRIVSRRNPLAARVAVNHVWMRNTSAGRWSSASSTSVSMASLPLTPHCSTGSRSS